MSLKIVHLQSCGRSRDVRLIYPIDHTEYVYGHGLDIYNTIFVCALSTVIHTFFTNLVKCQKTVAFN